MQCSDNDSEYVRFVPAVSDLAGKFRSQTKDLDAVQRSRVLRAESAEPGSTTMETTDPVAFDNVGHCFAMIVRAVISAISRHVSMNAPHHNNVLRIDLRQFDQEVQIVVLQCIQTPNFAS